MNPFVLSCESTADYPRSFFDERAIRVVFFHYEIDGEVHDDDLYASMTPDAFFDQIKAGAMPKTSQVSVGEYLAFWEPELKCGRDILHLTLSSGISGTYNSAVIAAEQLAEAYPERTIRVIDSLAASSGYGLLMDYVADLRDAGSSLEECAAWVETNKGKLNHGIFVSDLDCLKRGGRVSATSALIATTLKICPVMDINSEGKLIPRMKIRKKSRAIEAVVKKMTELADGGVGYAGKCAISHSACVDDAKTVARLIEEQVPQLKGKIQINNIGTVIGSHTGPGTVALFFMGAERGE